MSDVFFSRITAWLPTCQRSDNPCHLRETHFVCWSSMSYCGVRYLGSDGKSATAFARLSSESFALP
jgi:hypothetical protein